VRCSKATTGHRRTRAVWAAALGATIGIGGCATVGPAGGTHELTMPAQGSGAVAGWVSGEDSKQDLRRAATGAGVGTLAGGSVGYYMDVQQATLRERLDGSGVGVTRKGDEITLTMPGSLAFASDGAELNAAFGGVLDALAAVLQKYDKTVIEVAGHTDSAGSREHNQALSERRAAVVAAYLEKRGVLKSRVVAIGAGEARPIASNASTEGRARNRRVELTLSPLASASG
jgi:outer membrane protein OmpA-like peptidoglycan-associated protein